MEKMQESYFDQIIKDTKPENCTEHHFVKLYDLGAHSDYGCIKCGFKTLTPEIYKKK